MFRALPAGLLILLSLAGGVTAQEPYPTRAVTLVSPYPPGGAADLTARPLAPALEKSLRQPVIVVNRTGAGGAVGTQFVSQAPADGYTLAITVFSICTIPEADRVAGRKPRFTSDQFVPVARINADPTLPDYGDSGMTHHGPGDVAALANVSGIEIVVPGHAVEADGTTALHWAVQQDDAKLTRALLAAGAKVRTANRYGVTPLALAAVNGSAAMVELLLNAGADPNAASGKGETVLMAAARSGRPEVLQLLLTKGADPNAVEGEFGETALMWAAGHDNADAIRVLAAAGANLNAHSKVIDLPKVNVDFSFAVATALPRGGMTALMYAARQGRINAVTALAEIPGGVQSGRHTHPGEEIGYVLEGSVVLEQDGKPARTLKAGEAFIIPNAQVHNARNTGSATAKVLSTYIVEKGRPVATALQ